MKTQKNSLSSCGFAAIESLVAIGLVSMGALAIASFMHFSGRTQFGVESAAQFYNLKMEIKTILSSPGTCTPNFPSTDPNTFASPVPVTLRRFDYSSGTPVAMTGPDSTLGSVNSQYASLSIVSGQVRKKQQVAPNLYMMAYEVSAARSAEAGGAGVLMTEIPFSMLTDVTTGKVTQCFTDPFTTGSVLLEEFVCMLASGDQQYYDPVTEKCVSKYVTVSFPGPDKFTAGPCPTGTVFKGCQIDNSTNTGGGPPVTQTYVGYPTPISTYVPGVEAKPDSSNPGHCACSYSSTYVFGGSEACAVTCGKLNPSLVNIWPYQPASP